MKLISKTALATVASAALVVGCSDGSDQQANWTGTWELQDPNTDTPTQILLTENGEAYLEAPNAGEESATYYQLPLERVSNQAQLPDEAQVMSLSQVGDSASNMSDEGESTITALSRAQQAYYIDNNEFAESLNDLELGVDPQTPQYNYEIVDTEDSVAYLRATAKDAGLRSFSALIFVDNNEDFPPTQTIVCATENASQQAPGKPQLENERATCPRGSTQV